MYLRKSTVVEARTAFKWSRSSCILELSDGREVKWLSTWIFLRAVLHKMCNSEEVCNLRGKKLCCSNLYYLRTKKVCKEVDSENCRHTLNVILRDSRICLSIFAKAGI